MSDKRFQDLKVSTTDVLIVARTHNHFDLYLVQDGSVQRQGLIALRDRIDDILKATERETPAPAPKATEAPAKTKAAKKK